MPSENKLLNFVMDPVDVPRGLKMVAGLTGFTDSGHAVAEFTDYLLSTLEGEVVAIFEADELLDYRSRRPTIYFDQDHLTGFEPPMLAIRLVRDEMDQPFLLLTGYEPDFRWEAFSTAIRDFAERFDISSFTWVHSIPMPVPHTRPIGATVSGNREDLIELYSVWRPHTQVPSNAMHLVEYKLAEARSNVCGFVLLIPHYLADTEFPGAALSSLECISSATGLIFPTDRLREEGREFFAKIDEQVSGNDELAKLIENLEQRYDEYMRDNGIKSPLTDIEGELPSADEIADELEKFLARQRGAEDTGDRL